jgi:hypothetical protein
MGQALRTPPEFWKEIVRISGTKEHGKVIDSTQIFNQIKHQRSLRNSLIWPTHEVSNRQVGLHT